MSNTKTNVYEGLFLLPQSAGTDLGGSAELVKSLLQKVGAEIISFKKWDERRLAYEIKGNKRGLYFLCYFRL
ncbi:MAG: 30S ribosomal protein S6, partial [Phycisphaerales bacterium]|nr:30S ribosomal protein S6 [Phycisphaerales bacterium]